MTSTTIGIDVGGTKTLLLSGDLEEKFETGPEFSPKALETRLRRFLTASEVRPAGIGVAVPGLVDRAGCIAACDVLPKFAGWNPREALADLGSRVVVTNDVKAALAEEMHDAPPCATVGKRKGISPMPERLSPSRQGK